MENFENIKILKEILNKTQNEKEKSALSVAISATEEASHTHVKDVNWTSLYGTIIGIGICINCNTTCTSDMIYCSHCGKKLFWDNTSEKRISHDK